MKRTIRLCGVALVVGLTVNTHNAFADSRKEILQAWQQYFHALRSLQYTEKEVTDAHIDPTAVGFERQFKFILDGMNFRTELTPRQKRDIALSIHSYDGRSYQYLSALANGETQLVTQRTLADNLPYGQSLTLLHAFNFAFRKTDVLSIETLQKPETWNTLETRIVKTEVVSTTPAKQQLTIQGSKPGEVYKVIVQGTNFFPISYTRTATHTSSKGEIVAELSQYQITKTGSWHANGRDFLFPLNTAGKLFWDGKVVVADRTSIDPNEWKVNVPVRPETFTLPMTQVDSVVDVDAQSARQALREAQMR